MNPDWDTHKTSNQDVLRELVECNSNKSTQELVLDLNTSQSTICHHLRKIGKVSQLGIWVIHILSARNKENCIYIATSLLIRQRNDLFLTGDKNVSFMTMFNTKGSELTKMNPCNLPQKWRLIEEKLFCNYGGISMVLFILSFKLQSDIQC